MTAITPTQENLLKFEWCKLNSFSFKAVACCFMALCSCSLSAANIFLCYVPTLELKIIVSDEMKCDCVAVDIFSFNATLTHRGKRYYTWGKSKATIISVALDARKLFCLASSTISQSNGSVLDHSQCARTLTASASKDGRSEDTVNCL
jgi:hypothetical protein